MSVAHGASPPVPAAAPAGPAEVQEQTAVTVVLVDDSGVERRFIRAAIVADPGIQVVGEARTGRDAIALVERLRPSAVVLDLELPGMAAIEIIERIMAIRPTPILVCSTEGDADKAAAALAAGAIDVVARPTARDADRTSYAEALRRGVRVASRVKVITHPRGRLKTRSSTPPTTSCVLPIASISRSGRPPFRNWKRTLASCSAVRDGRPLRRPGRPARRPARSRGVPHDP